MVVCLLIAYNVVVIWLRFKLMVSDMSNFSRVTAKDDGIYCLGFCSVLWDTVGALYRV